MASQFYKHDCYMFEVYMMMEKVVLVGVLGLIDRGGMMQSCLAILVVLFFMLLIARRMPSKTEEYITELCLSYSFFLSHVVYS